MDDTASDKERAQMVIPLMKQAGERDRDEHVALHFGAAWAEGAACAGVARRALRAFLVHARRTGHAAVPTPLAVDAELAVSELVTNAIRHAPGPCGMNLRLSREELAITVWDAFAREPVLREKDWNRLGGHGMRLVHTVSSKVAVVPRAGGKHVTAYLSLASPAKAGIGARTVLSSPLTGSTPRQPS
ncbi:ATP-binding protein [Streptomyces sp. NPDC058735]|uniref:ATP-binding protein n=1 Tax=unclassified Streptomyces TaxID=2593676 RepID=UPI0036CDCE2A